jgi:hypothetical protein
MRAEELQTDSGWVQAINNSQPEEIDPEEYDDDEYDDGVEDEDPQSLIATEPSEEEKPVQMIGAEKMQSMIQALRSQKKIVNDQQKEVDFDGEAKEDFIAACEDGYPIIERTLNSIYEIGKLLSEVRSKLKKKKLYNTWLTFVGIPRRTAHNYVQAYDRFADRLPEFSCLGIKKLLIASKLPSHVRYVEANLERLAQQSAQDLEDEVNALLGKPVKKASRPERANKMEIGNYRITASQDGSRIVIECTSKSDQEKLIEDLTGFYSSSN